MSTATTEATRTVRAACPHDCPDTCAMRVTVEDGRAVRVQGDPDHATTKGVLCTKVSRYPERTYHPERVLHPLRRSGPKGSGRFERITWDAALDEIAARLAPIAARSPEAIVPYSYAGTMGLLQGEGMAARFFHRLGASLLDRTICSSAGGEALAASYGGKVGMHMRFFAESRLILIWGSNPITSSVHFWALAQEAKPSRPNVILCMTDDQGWADVSYNEKGRLVNGKINSYPATITKICPASVYCGPIGKDIIALI